MEILNNSSIAALDILTQKSVASFFQPIISIKKMGVVGLEALSHGVDTETQKLIGSQELFRELGEKISKLSLDRLFRDKGLEGFAQIQGKVQGLLLFLNVESSILIPGVVGSGHLRQRVEDLGMNPSKVVIEISPSENMDTESIQKFVAMQKSNQFLIALEDVNCTKFSLNQMLHLNPDIVKLEDDMVMEMGKDPFKREGIKTVVNLAHQLGALVIANGVENENDALMALELGVDMLQGSYFSKPQKGDVSTLGLKARIVFIGSRYRRLMAERMSRDKDRRNRCQEIALDLFQVLQDTTSREYYEEAFAKSFIKYPQVECLYLLNQDGVQVTESVCNLNKVSERRQFLFQPAPKGSDHSLKEYYYALTYNDLTRYLTEPYISLASGNPCITFSAVLRDKQSEMIYIFCADIDVSKI